MGAQFPKLPEASDSSDTLQFPKIPGANYSTDTLQFPKVPEANDSTDTLPSVSYVNTASPIHCNEGVGRHVRWWTTSWCLSDADVYIDYIGIIGRYLGIIGRYIGIIGRYIGIIGRYVRII